MMPYYVYASSCVSIQFRVFCCTNPKKDGQAELMKSHDLITQRKG